MKMNEAPGKAMDTTAPPDYQLLYAALQQFRLATNLDLQVVGQEVPTPNFRGDIRRLDAVVRFAAYPNLEPYAVEIKTHLTLARLGQAAQQLNLATHENPTQKGMLVTDYVNPNMAERLREMDIAFLDLWGNAYINAPPIYVYVRGNKPVNQWRFGKTAKPTRAFQATGLKVLFGFLVQPELLQAPYREIAAATDVALGTVGWVLTDLREHGYLLEKPNKERRLLRKRELLDQWVAAYPEKLRPKLILGKYRAPDHRWWQNVEIERHDALWGGEVAAAKLTQYLQPDVATIYADELPARLLLENQLKKDPDGDVEILKRFWRPDVTQTREEAFVPPTKKAATAGVVPPVLIYADLMGTGDARNIETAQIVYDKFVD
jgi:hypothetical protein